MSLQHVLLVSDLDGTLIGENYEVPQRNIDAINKFQAEGGSFAIATGRSIESSKPYADLTSPNGPCVCLNGGLVYDFERQQIIWDSPLQQDTASKYIKMIAERFPTVGIECFCKHSIHVLKKNFYVTRHLEHEHTEWKDVSKFDFSVPWYKFLIMDDPDVKDKIQAFTETFLHEDVRFVSSSDYFLEMLPVKNNKGNALQRAASIMGYKPQDIFAIGDYYNDVEMLEQAGVSVVPSNAPEDMKARADLTVGHCHQGAVADLIEYIFKNRFGKAK